MLDAGKDSRVADLVAVEMKDGQNGAVGDRIKKFVGLPCRGQWTGFRFAVADHTGDDQIGIVERRAEGVTQRVSELAAFVNGTWRRGRDMAGNAARKGKLLEQFFHPGFVLGDIGINLAIGSFEIGVAHQRRTAVTRTSDIKHVQIIFFDGSV